MNLLPIKLKYAEEMFKFLFYFPSDLFHSKTETRWKIQNNLNSSRIQNNMSLDGLREPLIHCASHSTIKQSTFSLESLVFLVSDLQYNVTFFSR